MKINYIKLFVIIGLYPFLSCTPSGKNIITGSFANENNFLKISYFIEGDVDFSILKFSSQKKILLLNNISKNINNVLKKKGYSVQISKLYSLVSYSPGNGFLIRSDNNGNSFKYSRNYKPYYIFPEKGTNKFNTSLEPLFTLLNDVKENYTRDHPGKKKELLIYYNNITINQLKHLNKSLNSKKIKNFTRSIFKKTGSDLICICKVDIFIIKKPSLPAELAVALIGGRLPYGYIFFRFLFIDAKNGELAFFSEGGRKLNPVDKEIDLKSFNDDANRAINDALLNFPEAGKPVKKYYKIIK